jgi:hypothetical protein
LTQVGGAMPRPRVRLNRDGAGVGGSASSVNVTFSSIRDFQPRPLARPGQSQLADWNNTTTAEPSLYCSLLKTRVKSEQTLPRCEESGLEVKELVAIRCIADDSAADHEHKRCDSPPHALFSHALCVPDVPASQPSSEVHVRPTSPCLLLALRRRAAPSREKELFDIFR